MFNSFLNRHVCRRPGVSPYKMHSLLSTDNILSFETNILFSNQDIIMGFYKVSAMCTDHRYFGLVLHVPSPYPHRPYLLFTTLSENF